jgi:hypothetical protein
LWILVGLLGEQLVLSFAWDVNELASGFVEKLWWALFVEDVFAVIRTINYRS